jgi:DNA-binding transcriptional ArsR family regulator
LSADEAQLIRALKHPLRRNILRETYGEKEISPSKLSRRMDVGLPGVSYHTRVLAECEAIVLVRTQPARGATEHLYRLAIEPEWPYLALQLSPPHSGEGP